MCAVEAFADADIVLADGGRSIRQGLLPNIDRLAIEVSATTVQSKSSIRKSSERCPICLLWTRSWMEAKPRPWPVEFGRAN